MAGKTAVKTDVKAGRFRQKVLSFMKKNHMTDRGDSVLAAVSGGADSVCLLLLLHEMAAELGIKAFAFHMNHGIRGAEADRDERFVMEFRSPWRMRKWKNMQRNVVYRAKRQGGS